MHLSVIYLPNKLFSTVLLHNRALSSRLLGYCHTEAHSKYLITCKSKVKASLQLPYSSRHYITAIQGWPDAPCLGAIGFEDVKSLLGRWTLHWVHCFALLNQICNLLWGFFRYSAHNCMLRVCLNQ